MKVGLLISETDQQFEIFVDSLMQFEWVVSCSSNIKLENAEATKTTKFYMIQEISNTLEPVDVIEVYGESPLLADYIERLLSVCSILAFFNPISISETQLSRAMKIANEKKKIVIFGHPLLYSSFIRQLKQTVNQSVIGESQSVYIRSVSRETTIFWYSLLALYLMDEIPISMKIMQNESDKNKGTKYLFMKFKENKHAKSIQHYATIHLTYFKSSMDKSNIEANQQSERDQIYIEIIGSNGVLYFSTDLISGGINISDNKKQKIEKTINCTIPVLEAVVDGTEIHHIIPQLTSMPYIINIQKEKIDFYEDLLRNQTKAKNISQIFKDGIVLNKMIDDALNSKNEVNVSKHIWN